MNIKQTNAVDGHGQSLAFMGYEFHTRWKCTAGDYFYAELFSRSSSLSSSSLYVLPFIKASERACDSCESLFWQTFSCKGWVASFAQFNWFCSNFVCFSKHNFASKYLMNLIMVWVCSRKWWEPFEYYRQIIWIEREVIVDCRMSYLHPVDHIILFFFWRRLHTNHMSHSHPSFVRDA